MDKRRTKNTTQYASDTVMSKQTQLTLKRHEHFYKGESQFAFFLLQIAWEYLFPNRLDSHLHYNDNFSCELMFIRHIPYFENFVLVTRNYDSTNMCHPMYINCIYFMTVLSFTQFIYFLC